MGLEAICDCRVDDLNAKAKVLLEARELILRAPFRRTITIADIYDVAIADDELQLRAGPSVVVLRLGNAVAVKWAKKVTSLPPSLAQKLGIGHSSPAFIIGTIDEPVLVKVLDGHTANASNAKLSLAIVRNHPALCHVLSVHGATMGRAPVWIVHGKGPAAVFGEAPVREQMRAHGYRDTKVAAVSATLTATRYSTAE